MTLSLVLVGCDQPEMFKTKEELEAEKYVELVEEVNKSTLEETYNASFFEKFDDSNFTRLSRETSSNKMIEEDMVKIGRELMKREVEIYSLKNSKGSFDKWVKDVFMYPDENEFLRHYKELGMFKEVEITFAEGEGKVERVQPFGETGFLYHSIMHLKAVNVESGNVEMAALNLILHIDKDSKDGKYKIVKMGGPVSSAVSSK